MKHQQGNRLDFVTAGGDKRDEVARAAGHSRWVRRGRWILPLVAVAVVVALFLWPMLTVERIVTSAMKSVPDLVLEHVHFKGLDNHNNPYEVRADRAIRPSDDKNMVVLEKPEGKLSSSSSGTVSGSSQTGRYDEHSKRLWLGGAVNVLDDHGTRMQSEEALVDIPSNIMWGKKPVMIEGTFGVIEGAGFEMFGNEAVVVVHGPAKATLNLHPEHGSARPK